MWVSIFELCQPVDLNPPLIHRSPLQAPRPAQPPRQNRPLRQNLPRQTRLCAGPSMHSPPTWHAWRRLCRSWHSRGWGTDLGTASSQGAKGQPTSGALSDRGRRQLLFVCLCIFACLFACLFVYGQCMSMQQTLGWQMGDFGWLGLKLGKSLDMQLKAR